MSREGRGLPPSFEEAYGQLKKSIEDLENGPLPLDVALARYEEGMRLAQLCNEILDNAELRIQDVLRGNQRDDH